MDSQDITKEQAQALGEKIGPMLAYLGRLRERINQERFAPDDELRLAVDHAYNAMYRLRMGVHYMTCRESTGGKR